MAALTLLAPMPARLDDAELVARARAGEGLAFEALYRRHVQRVASVVLRLLSRAADVEDVVQDAFSLAFKRLEQLNEPQAFGGWLLRIAVSLVRKRLRWLKLIRLFTDEAEERARLDSLAAPGATPEQKAALREIDVALERLPLELKTVWVLRFVLGCTLPEVAEGAGCSLATAKRRLSAANAQMGELVTLESME